MRLYGMQNGLPDMSAAMVKSCWADCSGAHVQECRMTCPLY